MDIRGIVRTGTIIFEHSDSTKQLSEQTTFTCGDGWKMKVKWLGYELIKLKFRKGKRIAAELLSAPDQDSPEHILNKLPDELLRTIFETLTLMDLVEIANVCSRFNAIARLIFQTKYAQQLNNKTILYSYPIWRVENLFRTFGSLITSFAERLNNIECGMAMKYCSRIKELQCTVFEQATLDKLRTLFTRLDVFYMEFETECNLHFEDWFNGDMQLKKLTLLPYNDYDDENVSVTLPNQNIPQLICLKVYRMALHMAESFFRANSQIQVLNLTHLSTIDLTLNALMDSLPNLTKLGICESLADCLDNSDTPVHYKCNVQHTHFRTLKIKFPEDSWTDGSCKYMRIMQQFVQHKVPLENIILDNTDAHPSLKLASDFVNVIGQIPTIKCIGFGNCVFDADQMTRLVRELPNLTKLTIRTSSQDLNLRGMRQFMEAADERLTDLHVVYMHNEYLEPKSFNGAELERMSRIARDREISLKMTLRDEDVKENKVVSMRVYQ